MNEAEKKARTELIKRALTIPAIIAGVVLVVFLFIVGTRYFLPLILAFLFSSIMEPVIRLISRRRKDGSYKKFGLPRSLAVILTMILFFSVLGIAVLIGVNGFISEITKFAVDLPNRIPALAETVEEWVAWIEENIELLPPEIMDSITKSIETIGASVTSFVANFARGTVSWAAQLPTLIIMVMFTIMTTYFLSAGKYRIKAYFYDSLPGKWVETVDGLYHSMIGALIGYLRAQFIIMCANFLLMLLGLTILGANYITVVSLIIALLDFLPSIGPGIVLVPWGVFTIVTGNFPLGVGLCVLYLCSIGLRQLLEPRVLSQQIGLHPILTIAAMYAGLQAMGVFGILIGPVTVLIIKYMIEAFLAGRTLREYLTVEVEREEEKEEKPEIVVKKNKNSEAEKVNHSSDETE